MFALQALSVAAAPGLAFADTPQAPSAEAGAVLFIVESIPEGVDVERIRGAIAREIGAPVVLAPSSAGRAGTLVLRAGEERRVFLSFRDPEGRVTEREVDLPEVPDRAVEVVALLAGNLIRDEAAELAASMKKPAPPPVAPEAAPPPAAPKPAPPPVKPAVAPPPSPYDSVPRVLFGADIVPRVGTSTVMGTENARRLSFNLFVGYSAGLDGLEVGGLANIQSTFTRGAQFAGIANITSGPVAGAQFAGVVNIGRELNGAQFSSVNLATKGTRGAQFGFVNVTRGKLDGAQSGFVNVTTAATRGAQFSFVNVAGGDVHGAQAGFVDVAAGELRGGQASFVNVVARDARGAQLGFVNVAGGDVRGAQLGLVNVANKSTFSFGLVNIIRNGRLHVDVWGQESGILMAGLKHGGAYFHNIYGVGMRPFGEHGRLAFTFGMGGHIPLSERFFLDLDALVYSLHDPRSFVKATGIAQARLVLGVQIVKWFGIYAGPSYNGSVSDRTWEPKLSPYGVNLTYRNEDLVVRGWPGIVLGIQAL